MKCSITGDFCMLYIEPADDKATLFKFIGEQKKPVVIMLSGQSRSRVFQRPEDFGDLKHIKRVLPVPIIFVIAESERLTHLAARSGFPVYASVEALSEAVSRGQLSLSRQRTLTKTVPLNSPEPSASSRKTVPLVPPSQHSFKSTPAPPSLATVKKQPRGLPRALIILSLLVVGGASLGSLLLLFHTLPTTNSAPGGGTPVQAETSGGRLVGHISFLSSEQLSENSSQGIDDEVQIDLHSLTSPTSGKSYYAWLLGDKNSGEAQSFLLGKLSVNNGSAQLFYPGDSQHTNLLEITSRFLVTEEDAAPPPITPSPDYSTWRYYGEIPQSSDPMDMHHYSYLNHLRHLLASDPMLNDMELPGGLNNWLFRNTGKLLEWTVSARDRWEENKDVGFVRRQTLRTLTYLDGTSFVQKDLPSGTPLPTDMRLAAIGLLNRDGPNQNPASYLDSIVFHLDGLMEAPGATPALRKEVAQIIAAMSNVQSWLENLRTDARQIVAMPDSSLSSPAAFALLNAIVDSANKAYTGDITPPTNEVREGVTWIHDHMQALATLAVIPYTHRGSAPEMIQNTQQAARAMR